MMGARMVMKAVTAGAALVVALLGLSAGRASAVTTTYVDGNECGAGGFENCTVTVGSITTPTIIKFGAGLTVGGSDFQINTTLFPSVTGNEFSFTDLGYKEGNEIISGTFTYTPGDGDPLITAFAVKAGDGYTLYTNGGAAISSFNWSTPDRKGVSHITFFDTAAPIPLPAGGVLLLTALAGLGLMRRRKSAA